MKRVLASLLAASALAFMSPAQAQSAAATDAEMALAREIIELSNTQRIMDEMMSAMAPQMADQIVATGASREAANRFVELFMEEFASEGPRIAELGGIAYAGAFTERELRDLRDFYASPTGRVFAEKAPELSAAMAQAGAIIGEDAATRALRRFEAELASPPMSP
ncbi:MAG: DUF2059 domain-containing protein [Hyphomonadaceae bacterium]|nr:DUF2059 domain-containing protein [Hyphomonadaceae bacterium]